MRYQKVSAKGYVKLGLYPVYCNTIYKGKEPFEVVGLREKEIELKGDFSGGTHNVSQTSWVNIDDCFLIKTVCEEQLKENGCQVHNLFCCGGGSVVNQHSDTYFDNIHENQQP